MVVKRVLSLFVAAVLLACVAALGMGMDRRDRVWLRDTLFGGGVGLGIGLASEDRSTRLSYWPVSCWAEFFGSFDATGGLAAYRRGDGYAAGLTGNPVDALTVSGMEEPVPVLKATLLEAGWEQAPILSDRSE